MYTSFAKLSFTTDPIEIGQLVPKIRAVEGLLKQWETKKLSALFGYIAVRFSDHVRSIRDNLAGRPVAAHFNQPDHSLNHVSITGILSTSGNRDFERHIAEQRLINSLKTLKPSGINVKFDIFKCNWIV